MHIQADPFPVASAVAGTAEPVSSPAPASHAALALALARAVLAHDGLSVIVVADEQQAYRLETELAFFLPDAHPLLHFPDSEVLPYDPFSPHQDVLSQRLAALHRVGQLQRGVLLTSAAQLMQRLPPPRWLHARSFQLRSGNELKPLSFRARLIDAGYESVSEVQTQGEFAVRGALIDLFPMGSERAYRIDLFDDTIDSIRSFDPDTQRSVDKVDVIDLLPAREFPTDAAGIETFRGHYRERFTGDPSRSRIYADVSRGQLPSGIESWLPLFFDDTATLADYLPAHSRVLTTGDLGAALATDWAEIGERFERLRGDIERPLLPPDALFLPPAQVMAGLQTRGVQALDVAALSAQPVAEGAAQIAEWLKTAEGRILFVAESAGRREALLDWLKPRGILARTHERWADFLKDSNRYGIVIGPLQDGLRLPAEGLTLIAEAQVFGLHAPAQQQTGGRRRARVRDPETLLRDLSSLLPGAPVVHAEHGVGRFLGLQKLDAGGIEAEYLVLEYARDDKLYVPVASLNLIHRYTGGEPEHAPLHALGSDRWNKARAKAREKAHDVAAELLQIQARRAARSGIALDWDEDDYRRFCAGFPFAPTADQQTAIDAVLKDLRSEQPMDRVVCGDVGFGKTEVALRAAFAAARAGVQVCVLAPTTLLVEQHAKNFADRFADFPLRVASLSRLRNSKEQAATLDALARGAVDVVVGTHRLLQDDIAFRQLGLVIIDEEHRFGVRHKEKLKNLRSEVNLLTLTATPIPRTLNMSLAGLRDLSIIATPPPNRVPIKTTVAEWSATLVQEACRRELRRGGQVFLLHNEVRDIEHFAQSIRELVPEAQVRHAHGQMRERELEQVMLDFYHQRFNVLVCTTIIESGIDVPTANTILIDRADHFGLAQLHQLRGRVGRSHHRGYAYLLIPSRRALNTDAEKRLEAIEALGDLGSGFALSTQDLEIRGAGELLGAEQSGNIGEIGFTLYADLLARAVKAIKSGKLDDAPFGDTACEVDLGATTLIPDDYIPDVHARLTLYQRIAAAPDADALRALKVEMIDRFGLLPEASERLFDRAQLQLDATALGFTRLRAGSHAITLDFGARMHLDPARLIALVQSAPRRYRLEGQKRLHCVGDFALPAERIAQAHTLLARLAGREGDRPA